LIEDKIRGARHVQIVARADDSAINRARQAKDSIFKAVASEQHFGGA
jgi:hypothetical protein